MELHPAIYLILEVLMTTVVVGFTSTHSLLRIACLPFMTLLLWECVPLCMIYMVRMPWASMLGGYATSFYLQYIDVALLSRWDYSTGRPESGLSLASAARINGGESWLDRLKFGFQTSTNWRWVNTPYAVKNIPHFSDSDPEHIPNKGVFLLRTLKVIAVSYLILDVLGSSSDVEITNKFFSSERIPIFKRRGVPITAEEIIIRIFAAMSLGMGMNAVQRGTYSIVAFCAVALGFSEPRDWPPFYQSYSEAYTTRRLWSVFWHQTNTHRVSSMSHFLIHNALGLQRGKILSRYLRGFTTFLISGVMHLVIDISAGISARDSGAVHFFATHFMVIVMEDTVIALWRYIFRKAKTEASGPTTLQRLLGMGWVIVVLTWSTPIYLTPMMYRAKEGFEDSVVPWSIVRALGGAVRKW
ncbi:membrane bound O-acyl transferase family-domain-containing protein [Clohesyomyces aquaticus]|uniref:Membrane bound O-acyl transferase family-domain-containing protein n=1 Tax=Clohesyomyces aquaticus TaxID=1231657 RepID=A0A1Y1ZIP2_9PLEO|nr:membrane bound O-acyl transferase family-domain-containing protein [Clohesyomyces aquaticus]